MATKNSPSSVSEVRTNQELVDAAGNPAEGDAAIQAIEKNKNLIIGAILLFIIGFAVILFLKQRTAAANLEASMAYSAAASEGSVEALDAVAADYEGMVAGGNALLMKSEVLLQGDKAQDAQTTLENFLAKYPNHPRHQQGIFALGCILHNADDLEGARSRYEDALANDTDSALAPLIKIRIADTWLESGDADKAQQIYGQIPSEYPSTPYVEAVEQKLELAKIGDIAVVPVPKPEPVTLPKPSLTPGETEAVEATDPEAVATE